MLKNLAASLIEKNRIVTTLAKAKAVQPPIVERMITLGKAGTLSDKRNAFSYFFRRKTVHLLFSEVSPRFMDRKGGYTRIVRGDFRKGDGAETAIIEFVDYQFAPKEKKKRKRRRRKSRRA